MQVIMCDRLSNREIETMAHRSDVIAYGPNTSLRLQWTENGRPVTVETTARNYRRELHWLNAFYVERVRVMRGQ